MRKKVLFTLLMALAVISFINHYVNRPVKDLSKVQADLSLSAQELFDKYEQDEITADQLFLDKIIQINGTVTGVDSELNTITFNGPASLSGVLCEMDDFEKETELDVLLGKQITLKGKCTGKLMDVVLIDCVTI